ncbi:MAG: SDR family NAD(P)-dependent oxidoreductase [Yoonia sp.]|nr:SDR family NAD(P)-dependent oxidoreductase [Yoonia sp.]
MTVLITGANRGIGAALLAKYSVEGMGALGTARTDGSLLPLDVTDPASVRALADRLADTPVSTLICNAGVLLDKHWDIDAPYAADIFADTFAANVTGVFLTIQAFLPALRATSGKIAIISSQMGSNTCNTGGSLAYRASKAASLNLGRNLANDLTSDGISVGTYHPGWVRTDMGGDEADISAEESANGLFDRITTLSMDTTGCFQTWDGHDHAL